MTDKRHSMKGDLEHVAAEQGRNQRWADAANKLGDQMTDVDDLIKRLRDLAFISGQRWDTVTVEQEAMKEAADALQRMKDALEWYASDEAWTIREVEGPDGDYGKRAHRALRGEGT